MERKKASDFPQELLDEFHLYVHGDIDRRTFLDRAGKYAVGGLTAAAILDMLKPNYAWAEQVPKDDKRIKTEYATVPSPQGNGSIKGYLVRPANASATAKVPAVLVVHENRGLNPYVEDVARRLGTSNFMAFAPDGLTSVGGYPGDDEKGGELFGKVDRPKMTEDFVAAATWLKARPESTGKLGVVGFCFGGGIANTLATRMPDLAAAVPFYGGVPPDADIPKIKAAIQAHHGELDTRLAMSWPAYDAALTAAKVPHEGFIYPKANHGFHNDTTPRYDEAAAKLAWTRTLGWFNKYLRST
jgi:carboxymethylenebutenolidase